MKSIFISSTFRDMQAERDLLHQQVFPALRKRLAAYGEDVQELDLRWGVDTSRLSEEKSSEFIVEFCIDSIERCKPYMVVLLGNRYGWVPDRQTIDATADERIVQWYEEGSSITHMEIQYGALRSEIESGRCIFCFRNEAFAEQVPQEHRTIYASESEEHARKLHELKEQIRNKSQAQVIEYDAVWSEEQQAPTGLEAFASELTEALWKILSADLDAIRAASCPEEQIVRQAQLTARQYLSSYVSRKPDREEGAMALRGQRAFWFHGEGGSGKSALMAKIASNAHRTGVRPFLYYGGNAGCQSVNTLAKTLLWWLNGLLNTSFEPDKYIEINRIAIEQVIVMQRKWAPNADYVVLIDGVDQMEPDTRQFLCWLSRLLTPEESDTSSQNFHGLIVSSTSDYVNDHRETLSDCFSLRALEPLTNSELDAIAQSHSARRGKKIDEAVMQKLRMREHARNPYYLSLMMQKLFMMDRTDFAKAEQLAPGMEGLSRFMCEEIDTVPDSVEGMTTSLLREACDKLGTRIRESALADQAIDPMDVLALLAASRNGLTLQQLSDALSAQGLTFPTMLLERLFAYLYDSFSESIDGVWNFKHRLLRESLIHHIDEDAYRHFCATLLQLCDIPVDDAFYYAWQARDVQSGLALLDQDAKTTQSLQQVFSLLQKSDDGMAYLCALATAGTTDTASHILEWLQVNFNDTLRDRKQTEAILNAIAPKDDSSEEHRIIHGILRQKLLFWDFETDAFIAEWKPLFEQVCQTDNASVHSSFRYLCRDVLGQKRYSALWSDVLRFLELYQPTARLADEVAIDLDVARLLNELQAAVADKDSSRESQALIDARNYLQEKSENNISVPRDYTLLVAEWILEKECYSDVINLLRPLLGVVQGMYDQTDSVKDALYAIRAFYTVASALKPEAAVSYLKKADAVCQRAVKSHPCTYLQFLDCRIHILLWQKQSKADDTDTAHRSLDALMPKLDAFTETIGADRMPVDTLQEFLDQRYRRVYRRRTSPYLADRDSGVVSADVFLEVLQNNYRNLPRSETRILPWRFFREQEADFAYMNEHYPALEERCSTYSVYVDMAFAKLEEFRFYDACQQEQKAIDVCNQLLKIADFMDRTKRPYMIWNSIGFRLYIGEMLCRRYYNKSAADQAETIGQTLRELDRDWIKRSGKTDSFHSRSLRYYLLKARALMAKKETLEDAFKFSFLSYQTLIDNAKEDTKTSDHDKLLCETRLLMGQILIKMEKDGFELLEQVEEYWTESKIDNVFRTGDQDQLAAFLYFCQSLSIRGRLQNKPALLDRAVTYMCRLAQEYTPTGCALEWERLYDELIVACRYYWNHTDTANAPACLLNCMLYAIARKAQNGELSREEQILFMNYGVNVQNSDIDTGKALPNDTLLWQILEQMIASGRQLGPGRLRARLAVSKLLKGDTEGAAAISEQTPDVSSPEEQAMLEIVHGIVLKLMSDAAPIAPLQAEAHDRAEAFTEIHEPFIALYLELACAMSDIRFDDEHGTKAALFGLQQAKALMETLDNHVKDTVIPDWCVAMCKRLMQDPSGIPSDVYLEALQIGSDGAREIYSREKDETAKDAALDQCFAINAEIVRQHHLSGDHRRALSVGIGVLNQITRLHKHPDATVLTSALELYELLFTLQAEHGTKASDVLSLLGQGADLLDELFKLDRDPARMEQILQQAAYLRTLLPQTDYESESWLREKIAASYSIDRMACMRLLELEQNECYQRQYLQFAQIQIRESGEGTQNVLEDILGDLWKIKPQTPAVQNELLDLIDEVTTALRSMPDDMMYLMYQALRDLGSDAQLPEVEAYIVKRRAEMPTELL